MEAKNFLMKYVTFTVKDMNLLIQDLYVLDNAVVKVLVTVVVKEVVVVF